MDVDTTTWTVGFVVGGVVVVIVVAVVLAIIFTANRVRDQVGEIVAALVDARDHTAPLWAVDTTRRVGWDVHHLAQQARHRLERLPGGG